MLKQYRRDLHQIPEIEWNTPQTWTYIKNHLASLPCQLTSPLPNSLAAFFDFGQEKTIGLRSDMDALPIEEQNQVDYRSSNGFMHACGHDGHMAMLLGLADQLAQKKPEEMKYNVLLIFQPGEEKPGGALPMIEAGLFAPYTMKAVFGLHIYPSLETGEVYSYPNTMMAGACDLNIEVFGQSSHAALPKQGCNALQAACDLVSATYHQEQNAFDDSIFHLLHYGTIHSGNAFNIIADHASIQGTIRYFDPLVFEEILAILKKEKARIEQEFRVRIDFSIDQHYPPLCNQEELLDRLSKKARIHRLEKPLLIAEDFAFYGQYVPSVFFLIGSGKPIPLHSAQFNFNESLLEKGVSFYMKLLDIV